MNSHNKTLESVDALVAIRAAHYSRLPELSYSTMQHHARSHLIGENSGVAANGYEQVVDNKCIGRQAFLLDEPCYADDGKLLRLPLDSIQCQSNSREESMPRNALDDGKLSTCGWGLPKWKDLEDWPKPRAGQGAWLELMPVSRLTAMGNDEAMHTQAVASQEQTLVGEPEALLEEMYQQYINEAQCC